MASSLSPEMLAIIRGEVKPEQKEAHYNQSLQRWWHEYAARKNDEEEEHVADSLLYDERCHLPRTAPKPVFSTPEVPKTPEQQQELQQPQQQKGQGQHAGVQQPQQLP